MANMSIVCPGTCSTTAPGSRMYLDRSSGRSGTRQPRSMAVVSVTWTGCRSQKCPPPSLRYPSRSSPLTRTVHVTQFSSPAKTVTRCTLKSPGKAEALVETGSMEETYDALAHRLLEVTRSIGPRDKYMVGLGGPPGSGKSTVAGEVVTRLNQLWRTERSHILSNEATDISVAVSMDGFHLYRWQLDAMEDPVEAHARRGAPWTFDPVRLVDTLHTLRKKGSVSLPSFDHAVGDPIEDDIYVDDGHRVVLVEGNYLLLEEGAWNALGSVLDERWYVEIDLDEAMSRIERRHVLTGKPPEIAKYHVEYNDRRNAELIHKSRWNADLWIQSIPLNTVRSSVN